jgi:hypothetical protein
MAPPPEEPDVAGAVTEVLFVTELLPAFWSTLAVATVALEVAVPAVAAVAVIVTDTDWEADKSPRLQAINADALVVHVPVEAVAVTGVRAAAS